MIRILIAAPFLFLLVLFALSNPQPTEFKLWPTDYAVVLPLSLAVLGAMGVAFILGALALWMSVLGARRRARRAEHRAKLLEAQVAELKAKLARPPAAAPIEARALLPAGR
jgi:uncharacterized integral membrane protein